MVTSWISHRWLSPHSPELPIGQIVDRKICLKLGPTCLEIQKNRGNMMQQAVCRLS